MGFVVLFALVAVVCAGLGCVNQRRLWWGTKAWAFRRPARTEPSDSAYGLRRAGLFLGAAFFAVAAYAYGAHVVEWPLDEEEARGVAEKAASGLENGTYPAAPEGGEYQPDVEAELREATRDAGSAAAWKVTKTRQTVSGEEEYEITAGQGDEEKQTFCMGVSYIPVEDGAEEFDRFAVVGEGGC